MVTITNSAESNRAVLRYIPEVVWGTRPGSGTTKAMRITSSTIAASKETKLSEEIRADRMVSSVIETAASSGGDVNYEFSAGSQDIFFQQFMLGTWSKDMNHYLYKGAGLTITGANTFTIPGDVTDYIVDGQYLKLEGFLNVANNAYVTVNGTPSFGSGVTTVTVDQTLVAAAGSAYTKVMDASDVLVYATSVTFTSGNTIDGGGANGFGSVEVGQKIYVDGLGKETGTIVCSATDPAEGDTFILSDGVQTVTFEIRTDSTAVATGNVHVAFSGTENTLAANIAAAVMGQFVKENIRITATASTATVTLKNHRYTGGSITESSGGLTTTAFTGGSATKGGRFLTVASITDNDTISVSETLSTDANSGTLNVVVKGSHLRNPGAVADIVKQSVAIETGFTDVNKYFEHDGMRVGDFDLEVKVGEIVKGKFGFKGRATTTSDVTILGDTSDYTVLDTTTTEVFNATANVGNVYKNGTALTSALMSITLNGDAGLREQRAVGERFAAGLGFGRFTLQGTFEAYFSDFSLYNDFINHTTAAIAFDFEDADHNAYWFTMPSVKFTSDPIFPDGIDKDVIEKVNYVAFRDAALGTMFMMDRFSSIYPSSVA